MASSGRLGGFCRVPWKQGIVDRIRFATIALIRTGDGGGVTGSFPLSVGAAPSIRVEVAVPGLKNCPMIVSRQREPDATPIDPSSKPPTRASCSKTARVLACREGDAYCCVQEQQPRLSGDGQPVTLRLSKPDALRQYGDGFVCVEIGRQAGKRLTSAFRFRTGEDAIHVAVLWELLLRQRLPQSVVGPSSASQSFEEDVCASA